MNKCIKNAVGLIQVLALLVAGRLTAQTFTVLHTFTATNGAAFTNVDGASPRAELVLSGTTLYGTASLGGKFANGTVFKVNTDNTGFVVLHSFTAMNGVASTNMDGANPQAELHLSGTTLFGTAMAGGSSGSGTVFAVDTNGASFTTLHNFDELMPAITNVFGTPVYTNSDGASPATGLISFQGTLYGTARVGGNSSSGTVFSLNSDGTDFRTLHNFSEVPVGYPFINSDGAYPFGLALWGKTLYGTADLGGSSGWGTVFALNTNGNQLNVLGNFDLTQGGNPDAGIILSGGTLYGVAYGGANNDGVVYAINTNGTGFRTLHSFAGSPTEGATPLSNLILSGHALYGTTQEGGTDNAGTVFAVNIDGTSFATLYSFIAASDGAKPEAGLALSGTTLYGTTSAGGFFGTGTVFSLSFPLPQMKIIPYGANVILTWPTSAAGFSYGAFTLQSATNLDSHAVWTVVSPKPVVIGEQNVVIQALSATHQFYRLGQ